MKMQGVSDSSICCPLVCLVPAVTLQAQAGMVTQPTPMFMVASMDAPVMLPHLDGSLGLGLGGYGSAAASLVNVPFSWPAEGTWPYFGEPHFGEEAPQQLPMEAVAPQAEVLLGQPRCEMAVDTCLSKEQVPSQIQMESAMHHPPKADTVDMHPASGASTLRRRRRQECYNQELHSTVDGSCCAEEEEGACSERVRETEDAQAREIAAGLLVQMQAGGDSQKLAVASFERLAFSSQATSRAAQIALEEAPMAEAVALAAGLRGHVRSAVYSKHANHVVQKITEVMPVARAGFVVDELQGLGHEVARHCFGCRVLCRIMEHLSPSDGNTIQLLEEVLAELDELCSHPFGSFVVRHVLEFGLPEHRRRVVRALCRDVGGYAKHKFGSHVVEAALRHGASEDQRALSAALLADTEQLKALAMHQFGRHVVRALLATPGAPGAEAAEALRPMERQLKSSRFGKSVLQALRASLA